MKTTLLFITAFTSLLIAPGCANDQQPATDMAEQVVVSHSKPLDTTTVSISLISRGPADSIYTYDIYKNGSMLYGFKNRAGEVIIRPKFELAGNFDGSLAPVIYKGKHGFCDTSGTIIYPLNGCEFVAWNNEMSGIDYFDGFAEGFFKVVDKKGKYGYVNDHAELVIPCQFEAAERFSEGKAIVFKDDKAGFINTAGEIVIKPQYSNAYAFSEDRAAVLVDGKTGFIDPTGKLAIPAVYYSAFTFSDGLAVVSKSENYTDYFYIDVNGKVVLPGPYTNAAPFVNGEAMIEKRGKCKIIDKTGAVLRSGGEQCFVGC